MIMTLMVSLTRPRLSYACFAVSRRPEMCCMLRRKRLWIFGWHHLSNPTCLIRPHLLSRQYLSNTAKLICSSIATFEENLR